MFKYILYKIKSKEKEKIFKHEDYNEVINFLKDNKDIVDSKISIQPVREIIINSLVRDKEFEKAKKIDPDLNYEQLELDKFVMALKTKLMACVNGYVKGEKENVTTLAEIIELCASLSIISHNKDTNVLEDTRKEIARYAGKYCLGYFIHSMEEEVK